MVFSRGTLHMPLLIVLTAATIFAVAYAHRQLPFHSSSLTTLWISRAMLILIGAGFAWVMSTKYLQMEGFAQVLVFVSAFGLAHVPAAIILFLKRLRVRQL